MWQLELTEGFEDPIPDWLNEFSGRVLGRLPTAFDGGQAHLGLRAGLDVNDFLYFTQEEGDSGSIDLLYQQLIVPSTVFGVEAGVDYGDFFALGSYEMGFTDFRSIYSNNLDVGLGYSVTDSMFLQADLGWYNRATPVYAGEDKSTVGNVRDSMTMFGLQIGLQQ